MALETATYISELNATNPASTDSVAQADDHIRLIKAAIKATFPNITGPVTATQGQLNSPVPAGVIVMWSGSVASIPSGWALCDGSNGTPNLRDRFVVGAGTTYSVGATGGSLTSGAGGTHTHTMASAGGHNHGGTTSGSTATVGTSGSTVNTGITTDGSHTHTVNVVGDHTHTVTPPYYALAYVMKL